MTTHSDMVSVRRIMVLGMAVAALSAVVIGCADNVWLLWGGSLALGLSSIMPQLFIPMATLYSLPENKTRNMGYVASGLLTGIVSARAVSGYVGEWCGWRMMFFIVAGLMLIGLFVTLRMMPPVSISFHGTYRQLMRTVGNIFLSNPRIRLYSIRPAMSVACMMSIWSCMAFHLAGEPFCVGSDVVGMATVARGDEPCEHYLHDHILHRCQPWNILLRSWLERGRLDGSLPCGWQLRPNFPFVVRL